MLVKILTDTASDFTKEELLSYNVKEIEMPVTFDGETESTTSLDEFWTKLIEGKVARTSQPSRESFREEFERAKNENYAVVLILISSSLSGTYESAELVKKSVGYKHIYIVDSLQASVSEKMVVIEACKKRDEGLSADKIYSHLLWFRQKVRLCACLDTLKYLARGGRISKTVASIGNLISLKPIMTFGEEKGEIKLIGKAFGNQQASAKMIEFVLKEGIDSSYPVIPIYAQNSANTQAFCAKAVLKGILAKIENLMHIGSTIGTHIGPGGFGLVYVKK